MKTRITACVFIMMVFGMAGPAALAQAEPGGDERQTVLSITPVFQSWSLGDETTMSEFTTVLALSQPIGSSTNVTLRASAASTGGDPARLSGLNDLQIRATHSLEAARLVLSLGLNIPTGKTELTVEEFATSMLLSSPALSWSVPGFGQGFNAQPGAVWAIPFSENVVGGIGVAYHYKGAFTTIKGYEEFDPGDEIAITGGMDFQLAEATNLSADVLFTMYGSDKLGSEEVFKAGEKIVVGAQFNKALGQNELTILGRYRTRGKGEVGFARTLVSADEASEPNQVDILGQYSVFINKQLKIRFGIEGKVQSETPADLSAATLFGARVAPEVSLSRTITANPWIRYQTGTVKGDRSISGIEGGVGLRVVL
ncbi:MAG: hypothetical protein ACKVRP_06195 [Bacteroidota bacterium]